MHSLFKDILMIRGVQGVVLLSEDGRVRYESDSAPQKGGNPRYTNWRKLLDVMQKTREADFVFENGRIYLRQAAEGYLLIYMDAFASIAMVKLNCDIVLPQLKQPKDSRGLKGLFKR